MRPPHGCKHKLSCASNEKNLARHTWDRRSKDGRMGALTTVVIPRLVDRLDGGQQAKETAT